VKRQITALGAAAALAIPAADAVAATQAKPKKKPVVLAKKTFVGPSVDMQWGPVQVTIVVRGKKVLDIRATAPTERPRSAFINQQAIPLLRSEALQALSTHANQINSLSGATLTTEAFAQSLSQALVRAKITP
jgi:uncharacterized protein with FMN-binding domain